MVSLSNIDKICHFDQIEAVFLASWVVLGSFKVMQGS
jgi:hypothetical protein